jgi:uncharacterized membrane protein
MKPQRFLIGDAVSFGWECMTNNIGFFLAVVLIMFVAGGVFSSLQNIYSWTRSPAAVLVVLGIVFGLCNMVVSLFINMAQIKIGVDFCDQKPQDFTDLYNQYSKFWNFLAGMLLYGLLVLAGFILLIIPGIYWAVRYHFVGYLIIDRNMGPIEAFHKSGSMTRGEWWHLFVYFLAAAGIMILGFVLCCIGALFAAPVVIVATAYVYRSLLATEPGVQVAPVPEAQPPVTPVTPAQ